MASSDHGEPVCSCFLVFHALRKGDHCISFQYQMGPSKSEGQFSSNGTLLLFDLNITLIHRHCRCFGIFSYHNFASLQVRNALKFPLQDRIFVLVFFAAKVHIRYLSYSLGQMVKTDL